MALLKYFNHVNSSFETVLPNPESTVNRVFNWKVPVLQHTDHMCKHADFLKCVNYHLIISAPSFLEQALRYNF